MTATTVTFAGLTLMIVVLYVRRTLKHEADSVAVREAALQSGLTEPASLHPVIDRAQCIGCGACVEACPERNVLGLIGGKADLIGPTHCIGHGACKAACPTDAIELVFGTEKRGVDIPHVKPNFETSVPGIFIAGELGGMGLIRNAIEQGRQAVESIRSLNGISHSSQLDLVIVGAGPAGFSASLAAMEHGLRFVTVEQETLGGTVAHYPRGKLVMTAPVHLPLVGKVNFRETTKEELLEFWSDVETRTGVKIRYRERVESIERSGDGFLVRTHANLSALSTLSTGSGQAGSGQAGSGQAKGETYRTRAVLLSIGRRGTPRKLGVPGEDQDNVIYRMIDPEQYRRQSVVVVGGGDSALEAATRLAQEPGAKVVLSYRGAAFGRANEKNRQQVNRLAAEGKIQVMLESTLTRIEGNRVEIEHSGRSVGLQGDAVLVCAGGVLPTPFLKSVGIQVETKRGTC